MKPGILHICFSGGWGGLEQYPLTLAEDLCARQYSVYYWAQEKTHFAQAAGKRDLNLKTFPSRNSLMPRIRSLIQQIRAQDIRVIHFHKSSDLRLAPLFKWLAPEIRLIFTEHMNAKKPKHSPYHKLVYRCLDHVISISDHSLNNNRHALPIAANKIQRLYAGIDLQKFKPWLHTNERLQLRNELNLAPDTLAFCLPGRLSPGKGHQVFTDAIIAFSQQHPDQKIQAFIVGGLNAEQGADEDFVHQLQTHIQKSGNERLFTFTGYSSDIQRLLQAMDIVCIPSRLEAFGLAVVEAMALALPVVGSDSGAIPEILGKNGEYGLLARPEDPQDFARAFSALAKNSDYREKMGQRALQQVRSTFDLKQHISKLLEIYQI